MGNGRQYDRRQHQEGEEEHHPSITGKEDGYAPPLRLSASAFQ